MQRAHFSKFSASLFALGFALICAAPASAQQATPVGPGVRDDGWVSGVGGASFGPVVQPGSAFAVEYGDDVSRNVQAYLTLSYFQNVMPNSLIDDLSVLSANLTATTGRTWDLTGHDQGVTLIAGGRYLFGSLEGSMRPYVGGGAGIINLKRTIADPRAGNVTLAVLDEFNLGEFDLTIRSTTKPIVEGAAGIAFFNGPVYVDAGYRFRQAFRIDGETLYFSQGVVGVGYRW
jgi:hypothetical protein